MELFENTPGYCCGVFVGVSASDFGNVIGSLADGFTSPQRSAASAGPNCSPECHACSTASTSSSHGISTALPALITATVRSDRRDRADERVAVGVEVEVGEVGGSPIV